MKASFCLIAISLLQLVSCKVYQQELQTSPCTPLPQQEGSYSKSDELKFLLGKLLDLGVPGVAIAIHSPEGFWQFADGVAKIEDNTPMELCHLHYLQSVAKTYQATGILKLYEQGRIELDAPISNYLPKEYVDLIPNPDRITVRMLLNHTSGIPEYNDHPVNITQLLQTPNKFFTSREYLKVLKGKSPDFEPGYRYSYRNTNYMLLSLISDQITGDHAKHMSEVIFRSLGLKNTFYRNDGGYLMYPELYNSYWDRHSDGILENVSQMQRNNVSSMIGDDGIVSTPMDAILFLKGLMEGRVISSQSLEIMKTGLADEEGWIEYGLGLDHGKFGQYLGYGHSGGGLGAGCELYYLPHNNTYFFIGINMGTITEGPISDYATPVIDEIHAVLVR